MYKTIIKIFVCVGFGLALVYLIMLSLTIEDMIQQQDRKLNCIMAMNQANDNAITAIIQKQTTIPDISLKLVQFTCDVDYINTGVSKNK